MHDDGHPSIRGLVMLGVSLIAVIVVVIAVGAVLGA
jgi:hypothetical protein